MLIQCVVMQVQKFDDGQWALQLLPIVDWGCPFSYFVHCPKCNYHIGEVIELDFNDIVYSFEQTIKALTEERKLK